MEEYIKLQVNSVLDNEVSTFIDLKIEPTEIEDGYFVTIHMLNTSAYEIRELSRALHDDNPSIMPHDEESIDICYVLFEDTLKRYI